VIFHNSYVSLPEGMVTLCHPVSHEGDISVTFSTFVDFHRGWRPLAGPAEQRLARLAGMARSPGSA